MWNPFRRKKKEQSKTKFNFDFQTFHNLFQYLVHESNQVSVFVDGFEKEAEMTWYEFPYSYQNSEYDEKVLERKGFKNFYELLNIVHEKAEISPVDIESDIENNRQYDLMIFNFYVNPNENEKRHFKRIKCSFYLFFVCENNAEEINSFRIFYSRGLIYTIEDLLDAKFLGDINNPEPEDEIFIERFEKVLAALSQETGVIINEEILNKHPNVLISKDATLQDFREVLDMTNYWKIDNAEEQAQYFYEQWQKDEEQLIAELEEQGEDYYDDGYFPLRFEIIHEDNYWHSDWKFDPEDMEGIIEYFLDEDWTFDYPEETYSHDLFVYVQKALSEKGLELMNMDTLGDSYGFFIVKKENVSHLLSLSNKLKLGIERLS
ncbi:DUF6630 family protein [Chryseobacterium oryctis]|uniref:DUF4303 domain-containing protein n=1 Tax=Chryseobacterium oryctis TaxID=2952618 RepID=A0ABT3HP43_9FLAO|nr:hypothetical protein [Chryseobacterium oryctis]MCW3161550.1 hypothetical protein [Chryseobacterium oryctis]